MVRSACMTWELAKTEWQRMTGHYRPLHPPYETDPVPVTEAVIGKRQAVVPASR